MGFALKAALSGLLIALISMVARRHPGMGALITSLPLISLLSMIWLWRDTQDRAQVADYLESTFWYILPTLPMFLAIPWMIRQGMNIWLALAAGCVMTMILYGATNLLAARFGIRL